MLNSGLATDAAATKMVKFRLRAIVLLLLGSSLIFLSTANAQCAPEPTTVLKGTVSLEAQGQPAHVQGAEIIVEGDFLILSAVTDRDGTFSFSNLDPGTYTVEASLSGLYAEQKVSVEPGAELQVVLQLKSPDPTISVNP